MDKYVLGLAFDDLGRIALIKKLKPEWQKDRWNGIGGKVEEGEAPIDAMTREFREETGVTITIAQWQWIGFMHGSVGWMVDVFTFTGPQVRACGTMEQEEVRLWPMHKLGECPCIENIPALIALARIPESEPSGKRPSFNLNY